jgi:poly(3-hydroxybutyrate) depolymerase
VLKNNSFAKPLSLLVSTKIKLLGSLALLLAMQASLAADVGREQQLVSNFWNAGSESELRRSRDQLLDAVPDVETLYNLFKAGAVYSDEVDQGQQESVRIAEDGTRFPYVFLIPENYDSARSYPVEFMLHGGVSRPEWEPGGGWWRRGYDSLMDDDKITVVPAAWNDQFWWQQGQAESIADILRTLKQTYNIDDNRVTLSGVSDGGTGAYFFAFKQPTDWAAFLPYIGHPAVLRNPQSGGGYRLFFENLMNKPMYIVNGEKDPLYPVSAVSPFIDILADVGVDHIFRPIKDGGHNTRWLPDETPMIEQFKLDNPRDPFPENINWVTDRTDRYNRNHWIQIDERMEVGRTAILEVGRQGNIFDVTADGVAQFTLLLNPEEVNFDQDIIVNVNGEKKFEQQVDQQAEVLLDWVQKTMDRSMLFSAELQLNLR